MTLEEATNGHKIILKIGKRLLDSSFIFFENGRYSSSIPLSILAMEELAKADFLRRSVFEYKEVNRNRWYNLTSRGGKSHIHKLTYAVDEKEKALQKWTETTIKELNEVSKKLDMHSFSRNKDSVSVEIKLFQKILPKLKNLKEDCLYSSWNVKERKWDYFDRRFTDDVKSILARFLFLSAKKRYHVEKFYFDMLDKDFENYSEEEWEKLNESENRQELSKVQKELSKRITPNLGLIVTALMQYEKT